MKKYKKKEIKRREKISLDPPNREILDLIGSPNEWTPKIEDIWLKELSKLTVKEIYTYFPPLNKPPGVSRRGRSYGWGG